MYCKRFDSNSAANDLGSLGFYSWQLKSTTSRFGRLANDAVASEAGSKWNSWQLRRSLPKQEFRAQARGAYADQQALRGTIRQLGAIRVPIRDCWGL